MPSPDPIAAATWDKVLARLDGEPEPDAPTTHAPTTAAPDASTSVEGLPPWFVAVAAATTTPPATTAPTATTAPSSAAPGESFNAWLDRRRAERAARGG